MELCDPLRARTDLLRYGPEAGTDGTLANADIHGWLPSNRYRRPDPDQGSHERRSVPRLYQTMSHHPLCAGGTSSSTTSPSKGRWRGGGNRGTRRRTAMLAEVFAGPHPIELLFHPLKTLLRKAPERTF